MQIKVNTSEIDCWNTDEIVCPYCGAVHGDSWEFGKGEDIGEMNCDYCGREFIATRNIETTYSSRPAGTKPYIDWEEGDIFDDGIAEDEAEKWANHNGEKPCEVVEQVHSWSEDYDGNVHILGREQKMKPIKKPCPYCDETPEKMMKKYEAYSGETLEEAEGRGKTLAFLSKYTRWLEAHAASYDRVMSGGKKTLKEWANILGKPVAIDIENRLCWFPKKPEIGLTTWIWYDEQFGCFGEYLPKNLIDFNGDWKDSLTLPDGWEEK